MDRDDNMKNVMGNAPRPWPGEDVMAAKGLVMVLLDAAGVVREWSDAASATFGYQRDDMVGRSISLLSLPEDVAVGLDEDDLRQAASRGQVETDRWRVRRDGGRLWTVSSLSSLPDGFLLIVNERTALKSRIAALEARVATLEQWHKEKDTLSYRISHAMRNSLAPLKNVSFVLKQRVTSSELAFPLGMIDRQLDVMGRLVEDLARVTRIDTGEVLIDARPFHLPRLIQRICEWKKSEFAQKAHEVECLMPPDDITMQGDEAQLERAITHLIDNAFRFTPAHGNIDIQVQADDKQATIIIRDDGDGLNAKLLPRITKFLTMSRAESYPYVPGAGLSTAKDLIEAHHGTVDASSEGDGKGCVFTVRLPLRASPDQ